MDAHQTTADMFKTAEKGRHRKSKPEVGEWWLNKIRRDLAANDEGKRDGRRDRNKLD